MKTPLTKTEITGLILLAVLIVAITGCAILLKGCREQYESSVPYPGQIIVIDTVPVPVETKTVRKEGKTKRKAKKKKNSASGMKNTAVRPDPFSDTIPQYQ